MSDTTAILNPPERAAAVTRPGLRGLKSLLGDPVLRKGMLAIFDQAVVSGTSFATSVAVGRLCGIEDLGVYYLALSVVLFLRGIQEQIISAPFSVFCHRRTDGELPAYLGSTLFHQMIFLIATALGFAGFAVIANVGDGSTGFGPTAWALIGVAPLMLLRESLRHFAFGRLAVRTAIAIDVAVAVLQLGGLGTLAVLGELTVGRVYLVMGAACAAASLGWWVARAERLTFRAARILEDWKQNWSFSKWALASHLVGCSTPCVLPWFVAAVDGTAATGVLAACTTLVGLGNAFMMGLANYLTPKAAHAYSTGGVGELRVVLKKTAVLFTVTLGGFALLCCAAGDPMAVLIYGDAYQGAGPILAVLAFGLFASSLGVTAGNGLWAIDKPSANFRADVAALLAAVISAVVLTPPLGVLGAATSSLIAASVGAVIRSGTLLRELSSAETGSALFSRDRKGRNIPATKCEKSPDPFSVIH